jgi:dipeptidyl aminopeptidase/acylaminoacyl peptidase
MIFLRDEGGSERYQVFHYDLGTGKTLRITDGKNRHTSARWSPKGDRIAYFSPKRNGRDNDLYIADPLRSDSENLLLKLNGGGWRVEDWSQDGRLLLVLEYISINESQLHIVDINSGELSPLTPKLKVPVSHQNARFDPRLKAVYFTSDDGFDFQRLTRLDLGTGQYRYYLPQIRWDVESLEISPDGRTLAVATNEGGASQLRFLNAESGTEQWQPKLPDGVIDRLRWGSKTELMYGFSWALSPRQAVYLDVPNQEKLKWLETDLPRLNTERFSKPRRIEWRSADGSKFDAWVYLPGRWISGRFAPTIPTRPLPVVILFHGGPESQFRPRFIGSYNYLTTEEQAVLICPNVRGSRGYGKRFLKADNGRERKKVLLDIERIYNVIAADSSLDQNRIAVMGGSYGGFMALHSMVKMNNFLKCGVDVVGISNFVTFLENTSEYRRDLRRAEYGDERIPEMRKFLQELSPLTHVNKITRPLLIAQGANDPRVPASESEQIERALRKKKIETWYLLAKDEGHGFLKQANREFQFLTTVQFLRKHLLEKE